MKKAKERSKKERKLTFWETIKNDCYALKIGLSVKKSLLVHSFFMQFSYAILSARWIRIRISMLFSGLF